MKLAHFRQSQNLGFHMRTKHNFIRQQTIKKTDSMINSIYNLQIKTSSSWSTNIYKPIPITKSDFNININNRSEPEMENPTTIRSWSTYFKTYLNYSQISKIQKSATKPNRSTKPCNNPNHHHHSKTIKRSNFDNNPIKITTKNEKGTSKFSSNNHPRSKSQLKS